MASLAEFKTSLDLPMAEAAEFWAQKKIVSRKEFMALAEEAKAQAFSVAGLAKEDELVSVYKALEKSINQGTGFREFQADVESKLGKGVLSQRHLETVFRTNLNSAYSAGRYKQRMAAAQDRPYAMYLAVKDGRTRPTHRAMHGKVFPVDHPVWDQWTPPNGYNCRCDVMSLSAAEVKRRGLKVEDKMHTMIEPEYPDGATGPAQPLRVDRGFTNNPGKKLWQETLGPVMGQKLVDMPPALAAKLKDAPYRMEVTQKEFDIWTSRIAADLERQAARPKKEMRILGALDDKALKAVKAKGINPQSGAIVIDDNRLLHMLRPAKGNKGLTLSEIKSLPSLMSRPEAILWDKRKNNLVYVFSPVDDSRKGKIILDLNYTNYQGWLAGKPKTIQINNVVSGGLVEAGTLRDGNAYELISGGIR